MLMSLTRILRPYFEHRYNRMQRLLDRQQSVQRDVLRRLLLMGARTTYGRHLGFDRLDSYERFAASVPIVSYEDIRSLVMRMVSGERDVLWPGTVRRYAQSSGTSGGASKFIPVTDDSLRHCHYRGPRDVVAHYLHYHPDSRLFDGRSFILGGSFATNLKVDDPRVRVGDLSAHLIECISPLVDLRRVPSRRTALLPDWSDKLPMLIQEASHADVTNISGVPSWFLVVLRRMIETCGVGSVHDLWPDLEVFFHGGIAFEPYRDQYNRIMDSCRMSFVNTYNASEGFFGIQNEPDDASLLLLPDNGVFYEFIPVGGDSDAAVPSWGVRCGEVYAMVITACNGLWRYEIGDTVKIVSTDPLKIVIAGRTQSFINAFGEELMVFNADAALSKVCSALSCSVSNYTAAPLYAESGRRGCHQWFVEFDAPPADIDDFANRLDQALAIENSDYQAKRAGDIFLNRLQVIPVPKGTFDAWLSSHGGKLGGQRKIPRLCNDRSVADSLCKILNIG